MFEGGDSAPFFIDGALDSVNLYPREDGVDEWGDHRDVVINFDEDKLTGAARVVEARDTGDGIAGANADVVPAEVFRIGGIDEGKTREALFGASLYRDGTGDVDAEGIFLLVASDGEAHTLAGGVGDGDLGVDDSGEVDDAENQQEEEGDNQGEFQQVLTGRAAPPAPEEGWVFCESFALGLDCIFELHLYLAEVMEFCRYGEAGMNGPAVSA
jgi:hypothetical protein